MALIDQIKQGLASTATQPLGAPGGVSTTEQAQQLLGARSGKAAPVGDTTPRASNLGEQLAAQQTQLGLQQVAQQGQQQAEQLDLQQQAQKQQFAQAKQELDAKDVQTRQQLLNQFTQMTNDFTRQGQQLDLTKQKAQVEQMGITLRLSSEKYMANLAMEGKKARLNDAIGFQEALQNSVFSDSLAALNNNLSFRTALAADKRTFEEKIASISIQDAIDLASIETKANASRQVWQGVGGIVTTGIGAYFNKDKLFPDKVAAPTPTGSPATAELQQQSFNPMTDDSHDFFAQKAAIGKGV